MPYTPTTEQEAILRHNPVQHGRVLAGPGIGKSATVVALIEELSKLDRPPRIKLLTFTLTATAELAKRVSAHPTAADGTPQHDSLIFHFRAFTQFRNKHFPMPLRIADRWEKKEIVRPTSARRIKVRVTKLENLIREMAANWEHLRPVEDPQVDPVERARFLGGWNEHRQIYGYTLLAELPYALRRALHDHVALEVLDYDLIIVDEYQDLNACDLELLQLIGERRCSIIGAGDDDQSIHRFRYETPRVFVDSNKISRAVSYTRFRLRNVAVGESLSGHRTL